MIYLSRRALVRRDFTPMNRAFQIIQPEDTGVSGVPDRSADAVERTTARPPHDVGLKDAFRVGAVVRCPGQEARTGPNPNGSIQLLWPSVWQALPSG